LGAVNFYRRAIPNFAVIDAPLNKLLQGKKQRYASLTFSKEASDALKNLKLAHCNHATLAHPRSDAETVLVSDASDFGCVAAIMQKMAISGDHSRSFLNVSRQLSASTPRF